MQWSLRSLRLRPNVLLRVGAICVILCLAEPVFSQAEGTDIASRAEELARSGQTVQAEALAIGFLKQHPDSVPVHVVLGELAAYRKAWPQAMKHYEAALIQDPLSRAAQNGEQTAALAFASHESNTGDGLAALATLQQALANLPRSLPILLATAVQAQRLHRLTTALDAVDDALSIDPENDRATYIAAGIHFDRGESLMTVRCYKQYLDRHPNDASAHFGLGRALRVQQQYEEAERELRTSIKLLPLQTEAYFQLGLIAQTMSREIEAKSAFASVLERMPNHAGALTSLGEIFYQAHDYPPAREYLERAVAADPDYEKAHYYLGLTLRRLGEMASANEQFKLALKLASEQQGRGNPTGAQ